MVDYIKNRRGAISFGNSNNTAPTTASTTAPSRSFSRSFYGFISMTRPPKRKFQSELRWMQSELRTAEDLHGSTSHTSGMLQHDDKCSRCELGHATSTAATSFQNTTVVLSKEQVVEIVDPFYGNSSSSHCHPQEHNERFLKEFIQELEREQLDASEQLEVSTHLQPDENDNLQEPLEYGLGHQEQTDVQVDSTSHHHLHGSIPHPPFAETNNEQEPHSAQTIASSTSGEEGYQHYLRKQG
eukprot:Sro871_g213830.2  (241) ;mRNA; r:28501-29223